MKAQPILLGVAIAGIAASIGYMSVADVRTSSNTASSETEVSSVGSSADSDLAADAVEATGVSSEPLLQSGDQSDTSSDIASAVKTRASAEFDASTGDSSIAALPSCRDAVTQTDMNICAHQAYETIDVTLNQTYQALTQELSTPEQDLLTDAELAWIEYRDKTCELEAAPYEGGTIQPLVYSQCLSRMTENRTAELQAHLDEISSR